ncbi:hypothetical protein D7X96_22990 [Corallococcus interemptor]|uniref:Roadblock/LC7 domain-containing protein n=1 Tax=Corallococcus interemptor TaxID=2316720 RepID=A0A3A8QHP3_9BACT|nr:hypothetical protein [Corallococcus interemptor]RKH52764.1 hypothetical protein D7Y23_05630 [Corallococcus sp. AB050B]RKH65815.1 hypothetical protein D7X96_22990 [Corallococcus interemptor]
MNPAPRTVVSPPRQVVRAVLTEALESKMGGEVVVKSATVSGRIFVVEHKVAWTVLTGPGARSFSTALIDAKLVSREDVEQVMAECRKSGGNFCETLVSWGLVPRDTLRDLLCHHVRAQLDTLFGLTEAQALFVPQPRSYSSQLTFELAELTADTMQPQPAVTQSQSPSGPPVLLEGEVMANVKQALEEAMKIEGAFAVCLADANSGMTLGSVGGNATFNVEAAAAGNTEVMRAKLKTMKALGIKDRIEDMLITLGEQYHIIRPLAAREGLFLYIALHRANSNLAMARFRMADVEKTIQL